MHLPFSNQLRFTNLWHSKFCWEMNSASGAGIIRSNLIRSFAKDTLTHRRWQVHVILSHFDKIFSFLVRWPVQHPFWVLGGPWGKWLCKLAAVCKSIVWRNIWSMLHMQASVNLKLWWWTKYIKIQNLPLRYFYLIVPSILCTRGPGDKHMSEFGRPDSREKISYKAKMK